MKTCPYCEAKLTNNAKTCRFCGESLEEIIENSNVNSNENSKKWELAVMIILWILIIIYILSLNPKKSRTNSNYFSSDITKIEQNNIVKNNSYEVNKEKKFEESILWHGVYRWMTLDEIKKVFFHSNNYKEWLWWLKELFDQSKYNIISFMDQEWWQVELWFYYYDNAFRLYEVKSKYKYNDSLYQNRKVFLHSTFWEIRENTTNFCFTCKEWYKYNKSWTTAYLLEDYWNNYFEWKGIIDSFHVNYESDYIINMINANW